MDSAKAKGSYRDYYKRNENDRLAIMDPSWFSNKRCLDIGCNSGVVTSRIAQDFHPSFILGIDIDKILIDAANSIIKRAKFSLKQQQPASVSSSSSSSSSSEVVSDIVIPKLKPKSTFFQPRSVSLKSSSSHSISNLLHNHNDDDSVTTTSEYSNHSSAKLFPYNIEFKCANILSLDGTWISPYSSLSIIDKETQPPRPHFDLVHETFDTILCLSVSKWIHLNYGDKGLMQLFRELFKCCRVGGRVVFEFQTWKSYLNKKSLNSHIKNVFSTITIKPEIFEDVLINQVGFAVEKTLGASIDAASGYYRPILVLIKPSMTAGTNRSSGTSSDVGIKGGLISAPAVISQVLSVSNVTSSVSAADPSNALDSSSSSSSSSIVYTSSSMTSVATKTKKTKKCKQPPSGSAVVDVPSAVLESITIDDVESSVRSEKKKKRKKESSRDI